QCIGLTADSNVTFSYESTMSITGVPPAVTAIGQPYSQANNVTGGTTPYTFSVSNGALPPGTSLDTTTGLVSGTIQPPATSFSYPIKATDVNGQFVTAATTGATSAPTISSVSPNSGPQAGGQSILIFGSFLSGATSITIGGKSVPFSTPSG